MTHASAVTFQQRPRDTLQQLAAAALSGYGAPNWSVGPNALGENTVPVHYVDLEDAIERDGLRMVVVGGLPSPWGEAAKGIFHIKAIDWVAVRLDYRNERLKEWAGRRSGPVTIYNDEPPRHAWNDILLLAERLAPEPSVLPTDAEERALAFGLAHEICGEGGLGWSRRVQLIDWGLNDAGGFPRQAAEYLARKYGHGPETARNAGARVTALLEMLSHRLHRQRSEGHQYILGGTVSAVDVYSATFMGLFAPLPDEHCPMEPVMRQALEKLDDATSAALDPILIEHRDMMYRDVLELPLSL